MNDETKRILADAKTREYMREQYRAPIDYARMRREFPKQKAALTRAVKARDIDKLIATCRKTMSEWDEIGAWPDDWSAWQRALDDVIGWPNAPRLEDLR